MSKAPSEKSRSPVGVILTGAAFLLLAVILLLESRAIITLHRDYADLASHEISGEEVSILACDDHMLSMLAYGTSDTTQTMSDFLHDSLREIDTRILAVGIIYTAAVSVLAAWLLARRRTDRKGRHIAAVILFTLGVFLLYGGTVIGTSSAVDLPFLAPALTFLPLLAVGLLSVIAGGCAFAVWLRHARHRAFVAILAVAVLIATYLFGMMFETGLFSPETVDSFDYLTEIDATVFDDDFAGEIRFDEEKNVMVLNGAEYPPEPMPNPEHFTGTKRTAAIALEVLNPYSAIGLPLIVHETDLAVPPLVLVLYGIKALLWILLPAAFRSRRRERA